MKMGDSGSKGSLKDGLIFCNPHRAITHKLESIMFPLGLHT